MMVTVGKLHLALCGQYLLESKLRPKIIVQLACSAAFYIPDWQALINAVRPAKYFKVT